MTDNTATSANVERREVEQEKLRMQHEMEKLRLDKESEKLRIENSAAPIARMIRIITYTSGAIAVLVVLSVVVISGIQVFRGSPSDKFTMPDVLVQWGGIILGFYFGQYISLVKDYMGSSRRFDTESAPQDQFGVRPSGGQVPSGAAGGAAVRP